MSRQSYAYGTCVAKDGAGVLLIGPPGSGKSDLALRLLYQGFQLIADDQVAIEDGIAKPPAALAGLLEVRGLGIVRFAHMAEARIELVVELGRGARLPEPERDPELGVPLVRIDPSAASAAQRVALALDCALGRTAQIVGAFAP
jgi:HPr kinase/phosphorylase